MRIITEPRVLVLGRTQLDWEQVWEYLDGRDWHGSETEPEGSDPDLASELAGRVCYDAFGKQQYTKGNQPYLKNILTQKHGSVLEHASIMLLISGVSRSLTHELVRHRTGVAYSQRSQRYVDESNAGFVLPPELADDAQNPQTERFVRAMLNATATYASLVHELTEQFARDEPEMPARERRIRAKQAARAVLPNAIETTLVMTANLRAWRHICEVRGGLGAEREIRRLACTLLDVLKGEAPNAFQDMSTQTLTDGLRGVSVEHSKV